MTTMPFSVSIESLLNEIHDGICAVTKDYRICYWNRAAEEITGFKAKEVVGRDFKNELLKHVDELGREHPLAVADGVLGAHGLETGALPGRVFHLHQEGAHAGAVPRHLV